MPSWPRAARCNIWVSFSSNRSFTPQTQRMAVSTEPTKCHPNAARSVLIFVFSMDQILLDLCESRQRKVITFVSVPSRTQRRRQTLGFSEHRQLLVSLFSTCPTFLCHSLPVNTVPGTTKMQKSKKGCRKEGGQGGGASGVTLAEQKHHGVRACQSTSKASGKKKGCSVTRSPNESKEKKRLETFLGQSVLLPPQCPSSRQQEHVHPQGTGLGEEGTFPCLVSITYFWETVDGAPV